MRFNLFSPHQFGFRHGHSTSQLITLFTNKITSAFENKQSVLGIFLDLSKAFDTINHNILLQKLQYYGIRGTVLNWFISYLIGRTQQTQCCGVASSNVKTLTSSVPQGSVLGPLLFLIYVNDFPQCLSSSSCLSFADDTTILLPGKNLEILFQKGFEELCKIDSWLIANKLFINSDKTKYILFKSIRSKTPPTHLTLKFRKINIEKVSSIKLLGITINEHLSWKEHILQLIKKLRQVYCVTLKIKPYLNQATLTFSFRRRLKVKLKNLSESFCNFATNVSSPKHQLVIQ